MKRKILLIGILGLVLTGCGKKTIYPEAYENLPKATVEQESTEEETDDGHRIKFTVENVAEKVEMTANLVIDATTPENVATHKVTPVIVDDDYLISFSKSIFDKGEYQVLKVNDTDLGAIDSIMKEMLDATEEKVEKYGGVFKPSQYYGYLEAQLEFAKEGALQNTSSSDTTIILTENLEITDENVTYLCHQQRAFIKGNIDGEPYILEYLNLDYEPSNMAHQDVEDLMIYQLNGRTFFTSLMGTELEADSTAERVIPYDDAYSTAERYLSLLGFNDYSLSNSFEFLADSASKGIIGLDGKKISGTVTTYPNSFQRSGYRFLFTPSYNDIKLSCCSGYERTTTEYDFAHELNNAWIQPVIQIDIDATGLRDIYINQIYESEEILSSNPDLLSVEQANEIAKQMYSTTYLEELTLSDIRLEYNIIQYADGAAMVPAWVYYAPTGERQTPKFAVNALDGSIIHFSFNHSGYLRSFQ